MVWEARQGFLFGLVVVQGRCHHKAILGMDAEMKLLGRPFGARNNTTTVSQQSFQATGADAEQVVDWYRDHLDGWTVIEAPHGTGSTDFAGEWEAGDRRLRVTAGPAPTPRLPVDHPVQSDRPSR